MKILDRYIFFEFLKFFIGALLLLVGVALIAKFLNSLNTISNYKGPVEVIVWYFVYQLPFFVTIVIGPSLLFAVSFTVGFFNESMEIPVIMAAGRSFLRTITSIILFSFLLSLSLFFFNELVTFPCYKKSFDMRHKFRNVNVSRQDFGYWGGRGNFEARAGNRYYYFGTFALSNFAFQNFHFLELNDQGAIKSIIEAQEGLASTPEWELKNGSQIFFDNQGDFQKQENFTLRRYSFPESGAYFRRPPIALDEAEVFTISKYIDRQRNRGEPTLKFEVEYYWHIGFPFVCLFLVLIGGLVGSYLRKGAMAASIGIATVISIFYFFIMFFGKSLGVKGILPPFIAGTLANLIFLAIASYTLFKFKK